MLTKNTQIAERANQIIAQSRQKTQAIAPQTAKEDETNVGGLLGGIGYVLESLGLGIVSGVEGATDFVVGGLAKLFGADDWAEDIFADEWLDYNHANEWYNPEGAMKVVGDVTHSIGAMAPSIAAMIGTTIATGGTAAAAWAPYAASLGTTFLSSSGRGVSQAYDETGKLGGEEFAYGIGSGALETGVEAVSMGFGLGSTARIAKKAGQSVAKNVAKEATEYTLKHTVKEIAKDAGSEAVEEAVTAYLEPYVKRATIDPNAKNASADEILYAALLGGLSGTFMTGSTVAFDSGTSLRRGNKIVTQGKTEGILSQARQISAESEEGIKAYETTRETLKALESTLEATGGKIETTQQKMLLGTLQQNVAAARLSDVVAQSAQRLIENPEATVARFNAFGATDADGNKISITVDELLSGVDRSDLSTKNGVKAYRKSIRKALMEDSILSRLAVLDATNNLAFDTQKIQRSILKGERVATKVDINNLLTKGSEAEIKALSDFMGVDDISKVAVEDIQARVRDITASGGMSKAARQAHRVVEANKISPVDASRTIPRVFKKNMADGTYRFADGNANIAVIKEGEKFFIYDYNTNDESREMTSAEMNRALKEIREASDAKNAKMAMPQSNVIDLSSDNTLQQLLGDTKGAAKYKIIAEYVQNILGGQEIRFQDGLVAVVDKRDAMHLARGAADKKIAQLNKIRTIISKAELYAEDTNAEHNKFDSFRYYKARVKYGADSADIFVNVGHAKSTKDWHIYDITNKIRDTANRTNGLGRPNGLRHANGISIDSIPHSEQKVNTFDEKSTKNIIDKIKQKNAAQLDAEIDTYARENIKGYSALSAPNRDMIRKVIREGRAAGLTDAEVLSYARVATRAGVDVVFSKDACLIKKADGEVLLDDNGKAVYADGFYSFDNNKIYVNPKGTRSAEKLLLHELTHAMWLLPDGRAVLARESLGNMLQERADQIRENYRDVVESASELAEEFSAHYAEDILSGKGSLERILADKPSLKDKILDFFKGAKGDYSTDESLSSAAKRMERKYKRYFDEFAARNKGRNAVDNKLAGGVHYAKMSGTTLSDSVDSVLRMSDAEAIKNKQEGNFVSISKNTPDFILKNVEDAKNLELIMRFDAFYLATRANGALDGHYHNYGAVMKRLPEIISNPLAIVRMNDNRLNILAEVQMTKGDTSIVSIELNTIKDINDKYDKYNLIVTVTPAKDNYVRNNLQNRGVRVEYEKEDLSQVNSQLHKWLTIVNDKSSNNSIPTSEQKVNTSDEKISKKKMALPKDASIKEQLKASADALNGMDVVASISEDVDVVGKSKQDTINWVLSKLDTENGKVTRDGFGDIVFDRKRISNALRYLKTSEERLAFAAVPQVLRDGIQIGYHDKHKQRTYDTTTFAAPIDINGVRGNMAAVVRIDEDNYYKVHRLMLPSGKAFVFDKKRDIAERAGEDQKTTHLSPTDNISNESIARSEPIVNTQNKKLALPNTIGSIMTSVDQKYKPTVQDKAFSGWTTTQIAFTNAQAGIETVGKQYGVKNIESLVHVARSARMQAEEMIGGNQYRIGAVNKEYLGEGLEKIFRPISEQGDDVKSSFFNYLFHYHNTSRMSLEQRSLAEQKERRETIAKKVAEIKKLNKRIEELRADIKSLEKSKENPETKRALEKKLEAVRSKAKDLRAEATELETIDKAFEPLENKPIFETTDEHGVKRVVTAQESEAVIKEYEKKYPEFKRIAEKVWNFLQNLNQYRVDTGLISQDTFDYLAKLYPYYVPTYRTGAKKGIAAIEGKYNIRVKSTIKKAKGSTKDLLPPDVMISRQVMETVRAGRINQLANALYDGALRSGDDSHIEIISKERVTNDAVADLDPTELRPKDNEVVFFRNGERITMRVSKELFAGFKAFNPDVEIHNPLVSFSKGANKAFKAAVTNLNPAFLIRNTIRDVQDAGINTKYGKTFLQNYARASYEISHNGKLWQLYKAMGGFSSSVFDFEKGFSSMQNKWGLTKAEGNLLKKTLQKVENANAFVEQLPRLAEFISSIEAGNTPEQALLDSADVTTNFGRVGTLTKKFNSTIIPFLNPAIQGCSKMIRNITSARSAKEFASLALRAALVGIVPMVLNMLMYADDEDYKNLRDNDKENNFLFKVGDTFVKIPRGRVASVIGGLFNRTKSAAEGEDVDWAGYVENVMQQVTPVDSASRTIFSPFADVSNNRTWYGTEIEGREFENTSPRDRYDESTSSIAIAIGQFFNYSPKKVHYLLDQYSGVIGDFILPATTEKAEKDFISGNFTLDPASSNKLSTDFYEMYDQAQYAKTAGNDIAKYQVRYLNRVKSAISDMYSEKSAIQGDASLSNAEKLQQSRVVQILINEAYKTALKDFELYTKAFEATASIENEDIRFTEATRLMYGAERALSEYNKDVYAKCQVLNKGGVDYDTLYSYYFTTRSLESDRDIYGNVIQGSKRKKVVDAIKKLKITTEQKLMLIVASGYSLKDGDIKGLSEDAAKKKLLKYITRIRATVEERAALAEACGFEVKNNRIITK